MDYLCCSRCAYCLPVARHSGRLISEDYVKAVNSIAMPDLRSPIELAITAAGNDLKYAEGNSAIIIVGDFSDLPNTNWNPRQPWPLLWKG